MVTVKYIFIILHADNDGEGGTFSTYSLLSRYVKTHFSLCRMKLTSLDEYNSSRSSRGIPCADEETLVN